MMGSRAQQQQPHPGGGSCLSCQPLLGLPPQPCRHLPSSHPPNQPCHPSPHLFLLTRLPSLLPSPLQGEFNFVHIVVHPLLNSSLYRVDVRQRQQLPPFGPLSGSQIVLEDALVPLIRSTAINANLSCQMMTHEFTSQWEERLNQIDRISARFGGCEK